MAHRKFPNAPGIRNVLGPGIRHAREAKGWSQDDLARTPQLAGWDVDRTLIARSELQTRCITDMELLALAKVLGVTLAAIEAHTEA
jgi:ribosome-binding protein aMBF1 (putative translation factor)